MYGKIDLLSTLDNVFTIIWPTWFRIPKYSQLYDLAELKGWFKTKALSNRALNMMFCTFPHIACSYMKLQHFVFMRNWGYSYSPKTFVVQHKSNEETLVQSAVFSQSLPWRGDPKRGQFRFRNCRGKYIFFIVWSSPGIYSYLCSHSLL